MWFAAGTRDGERAYISMRASQGPVGLPAANPAKPPPRLSREGTAVRARGSTAIFIHNKYLQPTIPIYLITNRLEFILFRLGFQSEYWKKVISIGIY